ncbi:uncharacterized protein [Spinacia oleracea]|uniref:FBD domain-containing protein n=1 Tax=Spinacia oleracea TaxID=3562 RepID=A0ABM3QIT8_SPIOL|nr:uncharacterized protein LOC110776910 [Spinacia oleracea]
MYLYNSHRPLMRTLFKSCPLLKRLWLSLFLDEEDHIVDIVAPNLKHLRFETDGCAPEACKVWIDAPELEIFETRGYSMVFNFVKDLKLLQTARVFLNECGFGREGELINRLPSLFQGISYVKSLEYYFHGFYCASQLYNPDLVALPIFRNLFHLQFTYSPMEGNSFIPSFLLSKLRSLEILNLILYDDDDGDAIRLIQDVLTNATVLEDLYVYVHFHSDKFEEKEV